MSEEAHNDSAITWTCAREHVGKMRERSQPKHGTVFSPYPGVFGGGGPDASHQDALSVNSTEVLLLLAGLLVAVALITWMFMR